MWEVRLVCHRSNSHKGQKVCLFSIHSVSECGFQVPKTYQAAAHIWGLPRWWKLLLLMYKIFDMRTFGLSHQIKGPTTVKVAKTGSNCKIANFTVVGPLIWCDNPKVRMSKILYINNNDFHHLGRPQMCAGAWCLFGISKSHSERLWHLFTELLFFVHFRTRLIFLLDSFKFVWLYGYN